MGKPENNLAAHVSARYDDACLKILVVDDSRVQRRILTSGLKRIGHCVREAASGEEALEICRAEPVELVISDWMMPGMNGLEFCRAFRQLKRDSYGYFILLTSKSEKEEVARGLEEGADDFLTKPFNISELRARIRAGQRIIDSERKLVDKNREVSEALSEIQSLYGAIRKDLIEARKLQQSLVQDRHQVFGKNAVSLLLLTSGHVGGDLVGVFPVNTHQLGLYAIDVSGHGISSALMTARLAGCLSGHVPEQNMALEKRSDGSFGLRPPDQVVSALNELVLNEMDTAHYFTIVLANADLGTGRITLCQAGHPHPMVQRSSGEIEIVGKGGMPVGLIDRAEYESFDVTLGAGDRLLISSDGVTECATAQGDLLDDLGLGRILRSRPGERGNDLFRGMISELEHFSGRTEFDDDVSAVLFEFNEALPATDHRT